MFFKRDFSPDRTRGIGGSDSAVVLNVSPYKSRRRLYFEKRGLFSAPVSTPAIQRGVALEPIIAALCESQFGLSLRPEPQTLVDVNQSWFIGNLDRWMLSASGEPEGVLEIKCPGLLAFQRMKDAGVDAYYILQLQHYLELTGCAYGAFAAHNAELWETLFIRVERDTELGAMIRTADAAFWRDVQDGIEPPETIARALPPVSTTDTAIVQDSAEWRTALQDYLAAQEIAKEAEALKKAAKQRLTALMGEYASAITPNVAKVVRARQAGRVTIDIENLLADHPEITVTPYQTIGEAYETFRVFPLKTKE